MEYEFRPNIFLTLGYQYVDLGTVSVASSVSTPVFEVINQSASSHAHFQVVTIGLNLRLGSTANNVNDAMASQMPVKAPRYVAPSNPWEGLYVGGRAGGAWGNSSNATYSVLPIAAP